MRAIPTPARPAAKPVPPKATDPTTIEQYARLLPLADVRDANTFAVRVADWIVSEGTTADVPQILATESDTVKDILKAKSLKDHPARAILTPPRVPMDRTVGKGTVTFVPKGTHKFDNDSLNKTDLIRVSTTLGGREVHEMRAPKNWVALLACVAAGGTELTAMIDAHV